MIAPGHPKLSLSRQCHLLRVSRSSLYHRPKGESAENLALMRRIDELFLLLGRLMSPGGHGEGLRRSRGEVAGA